MEVVKKWSNDPLEDLQSLKSLYLRLHDHYQKGTIRTMSADTPLEPQDFQPNFTAENSIKLPFPISRVMKELATGESLEQVARLSGLCTFFQIGTTDYIASPLDDKSLQDVHATATLPSVENSQPTALPRTHFEMEETIPVLAGLIKNKVAIKGVQTTQSTKHCCLYESFAEKQSIKIWKLREFESTSENETLVKERIRGQCKGWMKLIVESECRKSHK